MLLILVRTLDLALPAGLVWAALYGSVRQLDGGPAAGLLVRWSAWGTVASVGMAVARKATAWINNELASLVLLGLALVLGFLFLVLLWRDRAPSVRERNSVMTLRVALALGVLMALTTVPDIILLTTGIPEPGVTLYSSEVALNVAGYVLGLTLALVACWAVHRAGVGCSANARRIATTAILGIAMLSQATTLVQILLGRRLIPLWSWLFEAVVWLINHEEWFTYALMTLALIPALSAWRRGRDRLAGPFANPAEHRVVRADLLSRRRFLAVTAASFVAAIASATIGRTVAEAEPTLSPPEELSISDDDVWVEVSRIDDGHLHRFAYQTASDVEVRFIVIKKSATAFGVGLDACQICGPTGYYESGGKVICLRCGVAMNIPTIGFRGGCNPIPIEHSVSDGKLVIARAALEASAEVFA